MGHIFDDETQASRPGNLTISDENFALYECSGVLSYWFHWLITFTPWWCHKLPVIGKIRWDLQYAREVFRGGCLNPALVMDPEEGIVAVRTNLASGPGGDDPVVKVIVENLAVIESIPIEKGTRLLAVSGYRSNAECSARNRWADFIPTVIDCLAEDPDACARLREETPDEDWEELEDILERLDPPHEVELYHLNEVDWWPEIRREPPG